MEPITYLKNSMIYCPTLNNNFKSSRRPERGAEAAHGANTEAAATEAEHGANMEAAATEPENGANIEAAATEAAAKETAVTEAAAA